MCLCEERGHAAIRLWCGGAIFVIRIRACKGITLLPRLCGFLVGWYYAGVLGFPGNGNHRSVILFSVEPKKSALCRKTALCKTYNSRDSPVYTHSDVKIQGGDLARHNNAGYEDLFPPSRGFKSEARSLCSSRRIL